MLSRSKIFSELKKNDIGVNVHYIPVHTQPYYQKLGYGYGDFPVSEAYYSNTISLPLFSQMTFNDQDYVVETLKTIIK